MAYGDCTLVGPQALPAQQVELDSSKELQLDGTWQVVSPPETVAHEWTNMELTVSDMERNVPLTQSPVV